MSKAGESSSCTEKSTDVPIPLPRSKYLNTSQEGYHETSTKFQPNKQINGSRYKGAYTYLKDFFPKNKTKSSDDSFGGNDKESKPRKQPIIPPRPKYLKHRQNKSNTSQKEPREILQTHNENQTPSARYYPNLDDIDSSRSLQDVFPVTAPGEFEMPNLNGFEQSAVIPPSGRTSGDTNTSCNPRGLNNLSKATSQPKVMTIEKFITLSEKAKQVSDAAGHAFSNSQYNKAAKKYQECLDLIDGFLEAPREGLSAGHDDWALRTVLQMKLLRKDALQGFSDAQSSYSLPQDVLDAPSGAPPSYNDVLNEDLMMNTPELLNASPVLRPNVLNDLGGAMVHDQHSTDTSNGPALNNHNPILDKTRPGEIVSHPKHASSFEKYSNIRHANQELSVRPKRGKRPAFPPDVMMIAEGNKIDRIAVAESFGSDQRNEHGIFSNLVRPKSRESVASDTSFVTALSSPVVSPGKENINILPRTPSKRDVTKGVLDPFTFEDPFPLKIQASEQSFVFSDECTLHKSLTEDISFLSNTSYHSEVLENKAKRPFETSTFKTIESQKPASKIDALDSLAELEVEARRYFLKSNADTSEISIENTTNIPSEKSVPHHINDYSETNSEQLSMAQSNSNVDSLVVENGRKSTTVPFTDVIQDECLVKKNRLSMSVENLSIFNTPKYKNRKRHKLSKIISRSNESILQMFDPIIVAENAACEDKNEDTYSTLKYEQKHTLPGIEAEEDRSVKETVHNIIEKPLVDVERTEPATDAEIIREPKNVIQNASIVEPRINTPVIESNGRDSVYPDLTSGVCLEQPPIPAHGVGVGPSNRDVPQQYGVNNDKLDAGSVKSNGSGRSNRNENPTRNGEPSQTAKPEGRNNSPKSIKSRDVSSRKKKHVAIGRSAFYTASDGRDVAPQPPPRTHSRKHTSPWQEILSISGAVQLYMLSGGEVSSPFNRQSLLLLRRVVSFDKGDEVARVEVGGQLFSKDIRKRNTLVMMDQHGDYVVQLAAGRFVGMVLSSKVKKSQAASLQKTFEIYADFAKEAQLYRLPAGVEAAAAGVKKAMAGRAVFLKRQSVRAANRLKAVFKLDEMEGNVEIGKEFMPLKEACLAIRSARQEKRVRFF